MTTFNRIDYSHMCIIAFEIALKHHKTQKDKSNLHYFWHPLRVANKMKGWRLQIIAILHDIVEDTPETIDTLRDQGILDEGILESINILTKKDGQSYSEYLQSVKNNPMARLVKLADIDDNTSVERLSYLSSDVAHKMLDKYHKAMKFLRDIDHFDDDELNTK